jgi:hypothetical protein
LQWYPDDKGGGKNTPMPADMLFEQTITTVPDNPLAFQLHYKFIHTGNDVHYHTFQEVPAVYVNADLDTFVHYSGQEPWTSGTLTRIKAADTKKQFNAYTPERWGAYVDGNDTGLLVYAPDEHPWFLAFPNMVPTGGPAGSATHYMRPVSSMTITPNATIEGDIFILPGELSASTAAVSAIHASRTAQGSLAPMGVVDSPSPGDTVKGALHVAGWAVGDSAVSTIEIFVDGTSAGLASYGSAREDVGKAFEHADANVGWEMVVPASALSRGKHKISVEFNDAAGNKAKLPPIPINVAE